jgi:hypothetical protein
VAEPAGETERQRLVGLPVAAKECCKLGFCPSTVTAGHPLKAVREDSSLILRADAPG